MNITQAITLDLAKQTAPVCICAKQGDEKSRMIQITLVRNGEPYEPPSGASAAFRAQKPDGTMVLNSAVVAPDGTVTVELTRQTLAVAGSVTADVYLTDSAGSVLSSASFVIHVEPAPSGVQTDSENEFLHLSALVGRAEQAAIRAEGAVQDALHPQRRDNPHGVTAEQVGAATSAALDAHSDDRSNPHRVTAAQAGAAPAGYGLGEGSQLQGSSMWNGSGFFRTSEGTPNGINIYGCQVDLWGDGKYRSLYGNNASDAYGSELHRTDINGSVGEWEWVNPPMMAGVEYRTTQRYLGKPVYTKLIDCGTLPYNSRKNVSYGETGITVIRIAASTNDGASFPRFVGTGNTPSFTVSTYSGEMQIITSGMDRESASKVYAQIWYTK